MRETYVIGDIHGMLKPLKTLLRNIRPTTEDEIIFLGDYLDRGPDSKGVIDLILEMQDAGLSIVALMGNHEQMFLEYLDGKDNPFFFRNGGGQTLLSYGIEYADRRIPMVHEAFLRSLLLCHETEEYFFCHAGVMPGCNLDAQDENTLLWIRDPFLGSDYDWGKRIVFGHTPMDRPLVQKNKIGIDTGAFKGGKLTCLQVIKKVFVSVPAGDPEFSAASAPVLQG